MGDRDYHERGLARYAEIRNIDAIYPEPKVWFGPGAGGTPPWPQHPVARARVSRLIRGRGVDADAGQT